MLGIAEYKRCLGLVSCEGGKPPLLDFCFLYHFTSAFSINVLFLAIFTFLGFQKALEQDAMSSSVSVVRRRKVQNT